MMLNSIKILSLSFLLSLTGCAKTYMMTQDLRQSMPPNDLQKIQYFLSDKVMLAREITADERTVTSGHEIKILKGKRIEQVIFPKGCPGVEVGFSSHNVLLVSFEDTSPGVPVPALPFSVTSESKIFGLKSGQTIDYMGKIFQVYVGSALDNFNRTGGLVGMLVGGKNQHSTIATLTVDLKTSRKKTKERRVVPGRRAGTNLKP